MNVTMIDRSAKRIIDAFSDYRVTDNDLIYVAARVAMTAYPNDILYRIVEFNEQLKWEINNNRRNHRYVQDSLFD
jgi:hypothetical protein